MDIVLYNPLSRNGQKKHFIKNIVRKLERQGQEVKTKNILEIDNVTTFVDSLDPFDRIILVGGDGTLNRLANKIYGMNYPNPLYMYQAGTGNDFMRSLKTKAKIVLIKPYLNNLPTVQYNGINSYFLNGAGAGLDGLVIYLVNHSDKKRSKKNYFRYALKGFKKAKRHAVTLEYNNKKVHIPDAWMVSVMNSPYAGGGMKMAPQASRHERSFDVVVVRKIPKFLLTLIFPTIYLGWHTFFKRYVSIYRTESIKVSYEEDQYMQIDGEDVYPIRSFEVSYEGFKKDASLDAS